MVLTLTVMFSVQIALNYLFSESYYVSRKADTISKIYKELKKTEWIAIDNLIDKLEVYEDNSNIRFYIGDQDYHEIYNSYNITRNNGKKQRMPNNSRGSFNFYRNRLKFEENAVPIRYDKEKSNDLIRLCGIVQTKKGIYYIVITSKVAAIKQAMEETNSLVLRINLITLLISAFGAYYFAKRVAKPIEEIDHIALNVAAFDFTMRAQEDLSKDELGRLAHNINMMSDNLQHAIEELEGSNRRLEQDNLYMNRIDEMRKEFISNVSHELKTPITVLSGYTEMLKSDIKGIDKDYYYDVILEECNKMSALVHNLLNLSGIEKGLTSISLEEVDMAELVRGIVQSKELLFDKKKLVCQIEADEPCMVLANELYLEQAIINYVVNAIDHTRDGGCVRITVRKEKEWGITEVFNEGKHIELTNINKIWDSFYRGGQERASNSSGKNVGLGLYIVKTIMNAHHGQYGVKNTKDGVLFWLKLNLLNEEKISL